jgi:hypothetical protein
MMQDCLDPSLREASPLLPLRAPAADRFVEALRVGIAAARVPLVIVSAPDRQRAAGRDFLDQAVGQEGDEGFPGNSWLPREFNGAILTLCGGGQQNKLRDTEEAYRYVR